MDNFYYLSEAYATTLQKHRPRNLLQRLYTINNTTYKHRKLSPKPRLSLTSRRGDVSNQLAPIPQLQGNPTQRLNNLFHLLAAC